MQFALEALALEKRSVAELESLRDKICQVDQALNLPTLEKSRDKLQDDFQNHQKSLRAMHDNCTAAEAKRDQMEKEYEAARDRLNEAISNYEKAKEELNVGMQQLTAAEKALSQHKKIVEQVEQHSCNNRAILDRINELLTEKTKRNSSDDPLAQLLAAQDILLKALAGCCSQSNLEPSQGPQQPAVSVRILPLNPPTSLALSQTASFAPPPITMARTKQSVHVFEGPEEPVAVQPEVVSVLNPKSSRKRVAPMSSNLTGKRQSFARSAKVTSTPGVRATPRGQPGTTTKVAMQREEVREMLLRKASLVIDAFSSQHAKPRHSNIVACQRAPTGAWRVSEEDMRAHNLRNILGNNSVQRSFSAIVRGVRVSQSLLNSITESTGKAVKLDAVFEDPRDASEIAEKLRIICGGGEPTSGRE